MAVYPTHGAGSLCSTGIGSTTWSTIGYERRHDPLLAPMEVDAFARALLAGQPAFPRYFARMRPINQAGPRLLGGVVPGPPAPSRSRLSRRPSPTADSSSMPARPRSTPPATSPAPSRSRSATSFGTWLGWVDGPRSPARARRRRPADLDDLQRQALPDRPRLDRRLARRRRRGLAARRAARRADAGHHRDGPRDARLARRPGDRPFVIDVRQAAEYDAGHVPGAVHIGAGALADRLGELPATGRSRRSARPAFGRRSPRRSCDRPDSRDVDLGRRRLRRRGRAPGYPSRSARTAPRRTTSVSRPEEAHRH